MVFIFGYAFINNHEENGGRGAFQRFEYTFFYAGYFQKISFEISLKEGYDFRDGGGQAMQEQATAALLCPLGKTIKG